MTGFLFFLITVAWFVMLIPEMRIRYRMRRETRKFREEIKRHEGRETF